MIVPLPACLRDDFFGNISRHRIVMCKFHRIAGTSAGHRSKIVHIAEHFSKGNIASHHVHRPTALHTKNSSTPPVQVTDDITVKFLRGGYFYKHHRRKQNESSLACPFLDRK